jgi:predicted MFS family arabinose efflux permease
MLLGYWTIFVYAESYARSIDLPDKLVALCLTLIGVANFCGRLLSGHLADKVCDERAQVRHRLMRKPHVRSLARCASSW